jgi:hypothetical protein
MGRRYPVLTGRLAGYWQYVNSPFTHSKAEFHDISTELFQRADLINKHSERCELCRLVAGHEADDGTLSKRAEKGEGRVDMKSWVT